MIGSAGSGCAAASLRRVIVGCMILASTAAAAQRFHADSADVVADLVGLPAIGKWLIAPDLAPANWLGEIYRGKALREPINVVIIDPHSSSANEAKARLLRGATQAGFPSRAGHSSGYWGWMAGQLHPQFPDTPSHAFSDEPFELSNNHGRFFGPCAHQGRFIFVGAVSREKVAPMSEPRHQYVSFNRARDTFADAMDGISGYDRTGFVNLDNALVDRPALGTGDHDGMAVVLTLRKP